MSVRARRRTPQPERGRSDGQSSTWARVRTGGTMGVARTPRRYTFSTDDTVLRSTSSRRNTKISGLCLLARSAGVYYTGVRLMKHGAIIFPTRYLINYSNERTPRRRTPRTVSDSLKSALALARRYAIRGKLLAGSRLKRWACGHPPRRWRRWRKVLGTVRVLGTALNRVAAGSG